MWRMAWMLLLLVPLLGGCTVPNNDFLPGDGAAFAQDGGPAQASPPGAASAQPSAISTPSPGAQPGTGEDPQEGKASSKGKIKCGSLLCNAATQECCRRDGAKAACVKPGTCPGGM